jgi:TonB family protein
MPRPLLHIWGRATFALAMFIAFTGSIRIVHAQNSESNQSQANPTSNPAHNQSPIQTETSPEGGSVSGNTYSNDFFAFKFDFPKGWSVQSEDTKRYLLQVGEAAMSAGDPSRKAVLDFALEKSHPLLVLFEHPFGTPIPFNPAIMVYAEDVSYAPGIQNGQDFLLNLRMHMNNKPNVTVLREPTVASIGGLTFSKIELATEKSSGGTAYESFVVTIRDGYALWFFILSDSQKGLDALEQTLNTLQFENQPKRPEKSVTTSLPFQTHYPGAYTPGVSLLTPTGGVNFSSYLPEVVKIIKLQWYAEMPQEARAGEEGITTVLFRIARDGSVDAKSVEIERSSGKDALDKAAMDGIQHAGSFEPLPGEFKGDHIELRFAFFYNLKPDGSQRGPAIKSPSENNSPQNNESGRPTTPQQ